MSGVIQARQLGRWYGQVVGLNDLSVSIGPGITGLIGPNGAGKSTFMKLMVGEIRPSRGAVRVLGETPFANSSLYRRLGFCPQQDALYDHMRGREFVSTLVRLSGFSAREADERAVRAMERVHLADAMDRRIREYSKGMRQRTKLAQAIAHDPELLVVDEPLTGLDPVVRRQILALFRELGEAGVNILVSSHVLHEVQSLTQHIVLVHRGRLLAQGSVSEVRELLSRHPRRVQVRAREPRKVAESCIRLDHVGSVRLDEDGEAVSIETKDVARLYRDLPAIVAATRPGIRSMQSSDADLEAVFDYLVG